MFFLNSKNFFKNIYSILFGFYYCFTVFLFYYLKKLNFMRNQTVTLLDDNGFELLVNYNYEQTPSHIEEFFGKHEKGKLVLIEIQSVELVIGGESSKIILNSKQKDFIERIILENFNY